MYETLHIECDEAYEIVAEPHWEWICDVKSTKGEAHVYWHELTGELMWIGYDDEATYNKKKAPAPRKKKGKDAA